MIVIIFTDFIQSFLSLLFVIVNLVIGLIIASKYRSTKSWETLLVGIAWIGLAFLWIADAYRFIYFLLYDDLTPTIITVNLILTIVIIPVPAIMWLIAFSRLLGIRKNSSYIILVVSTLLFLVLDILLFYSYFTDPNPHTKYHYSSIYNDIILLGSLIFVLVSGLLFAGQAYKSEDKRIKMKGKLLLIAFILFTIGAILDSLFTYSDFVINMTSRILLLISSILFYMGFILPRWVENLLFS